MEVRLDVVSLAVDGERLDGSMLSPAEALPGVLFVHGWGGSQEQDLSRARQAAGLGCVCLTFDLRGHEPESQQWRTVTRAQNLADIVAAYDWLAQKPNVDASSIAVVGVSYGGYLASILTSLRQVRWLALRSPALYKDEGWEVAKRDLHLDADLPAYRRRRIPWQENRALRACEAFTGDVLIVEAEHDDTVPHTVIENFVAAFVRTRSLTSRVIAGADHGFSQKRAQQDYTATLIKWLTEMIVGGREAAAKARIEQHKRERGPRARPTNDPADLHAP
ncbi:MAG TPA: alpha/beta fold hydrolase [Dokdonella sp.]